MVTQVPADKEGKLMAIRRLYVQDGKVIKAHLVDVAGLPKTDSLTDEFCAATNSEKYIVLGATQGIGEALSRGMVLAMSIWWDEGGNMNWLDANEAGPCNATEGRPSNIVQVEPNPEVTYTNMRWGKIGSTYKEEGKWKGKGKGKC